MQEIIPPSYPPLDDVVSRADAFMQRQRPPPQPPAPPPLEDDDLPVLTDVVNLDSPAPQPHLQQALPDLEALGQELSAAIQKRLQAEIPTLVEAAMHAALAQISQDIRLGLEETTQSAIRDYMQGLPR